MEPLLYALLGAAVFGLGVFFYLLLDAVKKNTAQAAAFGEQVKAMAASSQALNQNIVDLRNDFKLGVGSLRSFVTSKEFEFTRKAVEAAGAYMPQLSMHLIAMTQAMAKFTDVILENKEEERRPQLVAKPAANAPPDSGAIPYVEDEMEALHMAELLRRQGTPILQRTEEAPAPEKIVQASS